MSLTDRPAVVAPSGRWALVAAALRAGVVAAVANTLIVLAARSLDVSLRLPEDGEAIPVLGFAQLTLVAALLGAGLAVLLGRWVDRPARWFTRIAITLTVLSLVPPLMVGGSGATVAVLELTHVVAALIIIPAVARSSGHPIRIGEGATGDHR